jgi:hypothetical protein
VRLLPLFRQRFYNDTDIQTSKGNIATGHIKTKYQRPQEVLLIFTSARPVDDEADAKIGKNKEYRAGAARSRSRRLCF